MGLQMGARIRCSRVAQEGPTRCFQSFSRFFPLLVAEPPGQIPGRARGLGVGVVSEGVN